MKTAGIIVLAFVALLGLTWAIEGNRFFLAKVFAPQEEQVRREVFEESKAYNQGMVQELQNMQFEYIRSDSNAKQALRTIILHRAADYPADRLPRDLASFINSLRNQ